MKFLLRVMIASTLAIGLTIGQTTYTQDRSTSPRTPRVERTEGSEDPPVAFSPREVARSSYSRIKPYLPGILWWLASAYFLSPQDQQTMRITNLTSQFTHVASNPRRAWREARETASPVLPYVEDFSDKITEYFSSDFSDLSGSDSDSDTYGDPEDDEDEASSELNRTFDSTNLQDSDEDSGGEQWS